MANRFVPEHYPLGILLSRPRNRLSRYWCGVRSASASRTAAGELLRGLTEHIAGTNSTASCTYEEIYGAYLHEYVTIHRTRHLHALVTPSYDKCLFSMIRELH